MFVLQTTVMMLFFNAATPVPYAEAITAFTFASRAECEAKSTLYGQRVAKVAAAELKRSRTLATVVGVKNRCEPNGVPA
jgi:hypothetical protein